MIITLLLLSVLNLFGLIAILILSLALIFILIRFDKKKKYYSNLLDIKNKELKIITDKYQSQLDPYAVESEKIKNLWEYKEGVTQILLHDLKNPLSLLINHELFSKELLGHAAGQMMNIVTNINDVQSYENAKMNISVTEVQLMKILNKAHSQVELMFVEKKLNYYNNINENLMVLADEKLLERVFVNLIMNAIKYAPYDGDISIIAVKENNKIKISIIDTGCIIPDDVHSLIFNKLGLLVAKRSNASRSGNLGLSFCKLVMDAHNQSIGIDSNDDQTTFWFTLQAVGNIIDISKEPILQISNSEIQLSDESISKLEKYISKLKSKEVYEFTAIRNIIKQIEEFEDPDIQIWINRLKQIVKAGDEESYFNLLRMAE